MSEIQRCGSHARKHASHVQDPQFDLWHCMVHEHSSGYTPQNKKIY